MLRQKSAKYVKVVIFYLYLKLEIFFTDIQILSGAFSPAATLIRKYCHSDEIFITSCTGTPKVVILTTSTAANDENFITMMIFPFQCTARAAILEISHDIRGCFTNVSRALQSNLTKIYNAMIYIYGENFKLKLCTCDQSIVLGTDTNFQLEIVLRNMIFYNTQISREYFRELVKH